MRRAGCDRELVPVALGLSCLDVDACHEPHRVQVASKVLPLLDRLGLPRGRV